MADPTLKDRAARLLRSLLPPKPRRRGRPGLDSVTTAIRLLGSFRKQFPGELWAEVWQRIYPEAVPNYVVMNSVEQEHARQVLRERVRWRLRERKRRRRNITLEFDGRKQGRQLRQRPDRRKRTDTAP
jgi:hypothetical protein